MILEHLEGVWASSNTSLKYSKLVVILLVALSQLVDDLSRA